MITSVEDVEPVTKTIALDDRFPGHDRLPYVATAQTDIGDRGLDEWSGNVEFNCNGCGTLIDAEEAIDASHCRQCPFQCPKCHRWGRLPKDDYLCEDCRYG